MNSSLPIQPQFRPELDPDFVPAVLWNRAFRNLVAQQDTKRPVALALVQPNGVISRWESEILPATTEEFQALNLRYIERTVKFLLWMKGGSNLIVGGAPEIADQLREIYSAEGKRAFDSELIGEKVYNNAISVEAVALEEVPAEQSAAVELGRHLDGCRIGFDLGGSDRKAAAVIDGEVVFSEEIRWDPYFEKNPQYHIDGIRDSLKRAAAHLPKVDAIGGSAAGVYVDNEVRIASLFRGVSAEDFETHVRNIFHDFGKEWGVPFVLVNDGEVTALAGSMSLDSNSVLGISMGTSEAAGYVDANGNIRPWLNELAFAPVDYREENGKVDEWSGDEGCGVQFFSQQGVARLAPEAGFDFGDMPFPEQLVEIQNAMKEGGEPAEKAAKIYRTIGICFGYTIAHYAEFYDISKLLILGRVTSGRGGEMIIEEAEKVLAQEFPELNIEIRTPDEAMKRHGQAVAAASLPSLA